MKRRWLGLKPCRAPRHLSLIPIFDGQNPIALDPQFDVGGKVPDAHQRVDLPEKRLKTRLVRFDNVLTRIIQPVAHVAQRRETVCENIQDDRFALAIEIHVHGELFPGDVFLHQERRLVDHAFGEAVPALAQVCLLYTSRCV